MHTSMEEEVLSYSQYTSERPEIETLHDYLEPLYLHGLDAVIDRMSECLN